MRTKKDGNRLIRTYNNGWEIFDCKHYHDCKKDKGIKEYPITKFKHKMHYNLVKAYNECPWHNVKKFLYKGETCTVKSLTVVFDAGYVLRLNYKVKGKPMYKYVQNLNSLKYLRLLKFKDITVLE